MTSARIKAFDAWAETLNLKHFLPHELRFLGGSHYNERSKAHGLNTLPPRELWEMMEAPAAAADMARQRLGCGLIVLSGYRSPAYNKAVGGAKHSRHLCFNALDLAPANGKVAALHKVLKALRKEGYFKGGIGRYASFCHVDTRGENVDF